MNILLLIIRVSGIVRLLFSLTFPFQMWFAYIEAKHTVFDSSVGTPNPVMYYIYFVTIGKHFY